MLRSGRPSGLPLGKAVALRRRDVAANEVFVSAGITADTAESAVATIHNWLDRMGRQPIRG